MEETDGTLSAKDQGCDNGEFMESPRQEEGAVAKGVQRITSRKRMDVGKTTSPDSGKQPHSLPAIDTTGVQLGNL